MTTLAEKFSKKPQTLAEKFAPKAPAVANPYNAPFRAVPGENPLLAGAKAVGNLPTSAFGFGKGIVESALHPIDTAKGLANIAMGAEQKGLNKVFGQNVQTPQTQNFDVLTQALKQRYGSLDNLQKTATEDPFGFGADVLSVLQGGAGVLGKTEQLNNALSKTAQIVTKPVGSVVSKAGEITGSTARFGVSQATGLNPETINEIVKNPQKFKEMNPELRMQTAQQVADTLDTRLSELSDVGKEYQAIRQFDVPVNIPQDTVSKVLSKYGVKLDEAGKIITSPESRPLSAVDRTALQDFITNYGSEKELTSNSFLNTREALSNLSRYEQGKTTLPTQIARDLRQEYDALGKAQIPGLANLDAVFAPEKQLLSQLKKDILTPAGELKDGAISKIANITGKGKEKLLERMKEIVPDIEDRVRVIKAVEDIERASGFKTGTYIRGALVGGGALTGNVPAIIGAILSQPEIAVPLLKGAGYVGQKARPILEAIKTIANDINNFTVPKPVLDYVKKPKLGMSIEDVSKTSSITDNLIQEAKKYKSAEDINIYKDSILQSPTLSKSEISTIKNAKTFDEVWDVVKTKGSDTQGMFLSRVENITKSLPKPTKLISKTDFLDKTKGQFNSIREVGGYKVRARMYDNNPWQIVDDSAGLGGGNDFSKLPAIKEFRTREDLWKYIKDNPKSQLTSIWQQANKGLDPLVAEAKKYKSAEEFVKAQKQNPIYKNFTQDIIGTSKVEKGNLLNVPDSGRYAWRAGRDASILIDNADLPDSTFRSIVGKTRAEVQQSLNENLSKYAAEKNIAPPSDTKKINAVIKYAEDTKSQLTDIWNKAHKK